MSKTSAFRLLTQSGQLCGFFFLIFSFGVSSYTVLRRVGVSWADEPEIEPEITILRLDSPGKNHSVVKEWPLVSVRPLREPQLQGEGKESKAKAKFPDKHKNKTKQKKIQRVKKWEICSP